MFFQEKKEQLAIWAESKLSQEYAKRTLWRLFAVAMAGNLISWVIPLILPEVAAEPTGMAINIEGRVGMYLMLVPLVCGSLITYSLVRIFFPTKPQHKSKTEFFYSYSEKLLDDRNRTVLLISLAGGGVNCILLFFTVIWGRMALYP